MILLVNTITIMSFNSFKESKPNKDKAKAHKHTKATLLEKKKAHLKASSKDKKNISDSATNSITSFFAQPVIDNVVKLQQFFKEEGIAQEVFEMADVQGSLEDNDNKSNQKID